MKGMSAEHVMVIIFSPAKVGKARELDVLARSELAERALVATGCLLVATPAAAVLLLVAALDPAEVTLGLPLLPLLAVVAATAAGVPAVSFVAIEIWSGGFYTKFSRHNFDHWRATLEQTMNDTRLHKKV